MSEPTGSAIAAAFGKSIGAKFEEVRAENAKLREQRDRLVGATRLLYDHCRLYHRAVETNNVGEAIRAILAEIEGEKK